MHCQSGLCLRISKPLCYHIRLHYDLLLLPTPESLSIDGIEKFVRPRMRLLSCKKFFVCDDIFNWWVHRRTSSNKAFVFDVIVWSVAWDSGTRSDLAVAARSILVAHHVGGHLVETLAVLLPVVRGQDLRLHFLKFVKNHKVAAVDALSFSNAISLVQAAWPVDWILERVTAIVKSFLDRTISSEYFVDAAEQLLVSYGLLLVINRSCKVFLQLHCLGLERLDKLVVNCTLHFRQPVV